MIRGQRRMGKTRRIYFPAPTHGARRMHLRDDKFIVSCPARSGSTMLVHLLRSNPAVICHGEVFGGDRIGNLAGTYGPLRRAHPELDESLMAFRQARPETFLYDVVFNPQGRKAVGFKFKTDEAFDPAYRDIQDLVLADRDIKVIHLSRRNLLDQYVSHEVVLRQTGVTLLREGEERPEVEPFDVDIRQAVAYILDVLDREEQALDAYRGHRAIRVSYDDLVQADHPVHGELQAFLGIPHKPLSTPTRKILASNASLVRNLDDVRNVLRLMGLQDRI